MHRELKKKLAGVKFNSGISQDQHALPRKGTRRNGILWILRGVQLVGLQPALATSKKGQLVAMSRATDPGPD